MGNKENPVQKYRGYFICRVGPCWRIKTDPKLSNAIHYGSFETVPEAKEYIKTFVPKRDVGPFKDSAKKAYKIQFTVYRTGAVSLNGIRYGPSTHVARALVEAAKELKEVKMDW